jgi:hypothetical protein
MIVIQSVKGCQGMLRVIVKRNCIAQDSYPLCGFNLSGYRFERLGQLGDKWVSGALVKLEEFRAEFPVLKNFRDKYPVDGEFSRQYKGDPKIVGSPQVLLEDDVRQ